MCSFVEKGRGKQMEKEGVPKAIETIQSYFMLQDKYFFENLKKIHNFTIRDYMVFHYIYVENPMHQVQPSKLAQYLDISPSAVSQLITNYEKRNWVKRVHSDTDRRNVYVSLTNEAHELMIERLPFEEVQIRKVISKCSTEDISAFIRVLSLINQQIPIEE